MGGPYIDDEDLDEQRRREEEASAPPVTIGAPAPPPPITDAPPVATAPVGGAQPMLGSSPPPMIPLSPVSHPDAPPVISAGRIAIHPDAPPVVPRPPRPEDYAPHKMKLWQKILSPFAVGAAAFGNPQVGSAVADSLYEAPKREAAERYKEAVESYKLNQADNPKPQEPKWSVVPGMVGPKGEIVQEEQNTGQIRYAPNVEGMHSAKNPNETPAQEVMHDLLTGDNGSPRVNPATNKPYTVTEAFQESQKPSQPNETEKAISDTVEAHGWPNDAQHRNMARDENAKRNPQAKVEVNPPKGDQGVLMSVPDGKGGHKLVRIQPGEAIPEGSATPTQAGSVDIKSEQGEKAGKDALQYADDYMKLGAFTGPGDEALMEKFFELAKPSSGFRMTQAQIDMLKNAQGWMNSLEAKARHAITGTWFSDDQRAQIAGTMKMLANSRQPSGGNNAGGGDLGAAPAGKAEGSTGTLPDGTKVIVKGGRLHKQ